MSAYTSHRIASSGLFALFSLLALALGVGAARPLALATGGSLLALFAFTRAGFRTSLGPFASALATLADLSLLTCALSLTGGFRSPYALLLPVGVALAWHLEGKSAARFYALVSVLGVAALVTLSGGPLPAGADLYPLLATALAAPALLAALETLGGIRIEREAAAPVTAGEELSRSASPAGTAPVRRDSNEEVLHDLKSPLSVIRVYTDLIAEAAGRGELPSAEYLGNLAREVELAERLVGTPPGAAGSAPAGNAMRFDLASPPRAPAAPAPAPPAPADLVEILGSLATAYRLSYGNRLRIEFIAERPELPVTADPVALQRAFRNVVENAIKYTPDGGEVRIRAGAAGPHAFVVVKDTGMGMSDADRARAFDFAFRGSGAVAAGTRGKGLGLALTKEILEANGGKISLSSEAGYGSEVTILLPFKR